MVWSRMRVMVCVCVCELAQYRSQFPFAFTHDDAVVPRCLLCAAMWCGTLMCSSRGKLGQKAAAAVVASQARRWWPAAGHSRSRVCLSTPSAAW
eukprot:15180645-Alexandrium_andersonii.AAC.1